jgi:hypothetical protein
VTKEAGGFAGLFYLQALHDAAFIGRSSNKPDGTSETAEHR